MEKYKELFEHSKDVFKEEQNRFNRIDAKATQYLAVLTLLLGAAGYFGKWLIDTIVPPVTALDWILFSLGVFLFISIIFSWFFNFRVLRLHSIYKIPLDDETINFYDQNRIIDIYFAMSKGLKEALKYNREIVDKKAKILSYGYKAIIISMSFLILFTLFFAVRNWDTNSQIKKKKENIKMPENENQDQQTNDDSTNQTEPVSDEKPNTDIKPPNFQLVTEGYDPKKLIIKKSKEQKDTSDSSEKKD